MTTAVAPSPWQLGRCPACGDRVRWAETAAGANLALDPTPSTQGPYVVVAGRALRLAELVDLDLEQHADDQRYAPHPASCPRWGRTSTEPTPTPRRTRPGARQLARTSACPHCHRPVLWVQTRHGRRIPLEPRTDPRAILIPLRGRAYEVSELRAMGEPWSDWADALGHLPHPATCPLWPRPEPVKVRGSAQGHLACWACGVIDHTVRHTTTGDRCSQCRSAEAGDR